MTAAILILLVAFVVAGILWLMFCAEGEGEDGHVRGRHRRGGPS